jgi:orotate phosphoribosyltransferase
MSQGNLFLTGNFKLSSGQLSDFKIDCDKLTDEDIKTLAVLVSKRIRFRNAVGVPTGGNRLASALAPYAIDDSSLPTLIVEDVVTTGQSMERVKRTIEGPVIGVTIFARDICPYWVQPIFQLCFYD